MIVYPNNVLPTSPMKIFALSQFHGKKPTKAINKNNKKLSPVKKYNDAITKIDSELA